jgi:hypothetical protein
MGAGGQFVEMGQAAVAAQVVGVVDDGLDAQRPAVRQILLDPGVPVERVDGDLHAAGDGLGLERQWLGLGASRLTNGHPPFPGPVPHAGPGNRTPARSDTRATGMPAAGSHYPYTTPVGTGGISRNAQHAQLHGIAVEPHARPQRHAGISPA